MFNHKYVMPLSAAVALLLSSAPLSWAEDPVAAPSVTPAPVNTSVNTPVNAPAGGDNSASVATPNQPAQPTPPVTEKKPVTADVSSSLPATDASSNDIGKRVAEINERMALLSAQLAELELKAKIASTVAQIEDIGNKDKKDKKKEDSGTLTSSLGNSGGLFPSQATSSRAAEETPKYVPPVRVSSAMPVVKSIEGVDGRLKAVLKVRGEGTRTVRVGETVSGWTVKNIAVDSVTVQKGKTVQELYFGASGEEDGTLSVGSGSTSLPMMPSFGSSRSTPMGIDPMVYKE